MQKRIHLLFIVLFLTTQLFAQKNAENQAPTIVLSGTISDANNGETLIGATVLVPQFTAGTTTNEYGFYSVSLPQGKDSIQVEVSYIGFQTMTFNILPTADVKKNIELSTGVRLQEVVVKADSYREQLNSTEMSVENISTVEVKMIPALLGETDILRTIKLKPGIPSASEGTTGLYVRGGSTDQNLIVLDEAVVYNPNHLFGFFSTFNTDAVKDLKLYKGGFPAQYGGRLSSVIDVRLKEGNNKKFSGSGGLGLISSRLTLEAPIQKNKSSFMISGRRTYVDIFTNQINKQNEDNEDFSQIPAYYFYDLNTKVNYQLGEKDRLYLSGYFGRDKFKFNSDNFNFGFDWGNATGTARWNHVFTPKLFANTTLTYSDYNYEISTRVTSFGFDIGSAVTDANLKTDFYYVANKKNTIRFGANVTYHQFEVGRLRGGSDDGEVSFSAGDEYDGVQFGLYASDEWEPNDKLKINGGLRISGFSNDGKTYIRPEPRLAAKYSVNDQFTVKGSYARMNQYLHLVSTSGIALPTDVWYPSTNQIKPQVSDIVAVGGSYLLGKGWFINNEYYYKWLGNQVDFVDFANLFVNENLEDEFAIGKGFGYGAELSIEKKEGKLKGWIGYTIAYIRKGKFETFGDRQYTNADDFIAPRYDRRHDLSIVTMYDIAPRLTVSATAVYGSGDRTWISTGRFTFQDALGGQTELVVPDYAGTRNNIQMPDFFRMDFSVVWRFFPRWGESDLTFSILNLTNRRNPFFLYLDVEGETVTDPNGNETIIPERVAVKQVSLFPILGSATFNFKF